MRPPDLADIRAAAARLEGRIERTPLVAGDELGASCRLLLKLENRQRTRSFKPRGAFNAALLAVERGSVRGLVTYSSGNHGQAVALAAQELDLPCVVVSPEDVRLTKRRAMESRGASVELCGLTSSERQARAEEVSRERGLHLVPPYDHPDVVAGQGTVGLEIFEDLPALDVACVPVGGGGLVSGVALALAALRPGARIVGVEPEDADDARRSLAAGRLESNEAPSRSACDGLRNTRLGDVNWPIVQRLVTGVVTVTDEQVERARTALEAAGLGPVEPSGAAAAAAVLEGAVGRPGETVACVVSGGNSSPAPSFPNEERG